MVIADKRDVLVVGAGISGLATAWELQAAGADVAVLEADESVGGCMRTERRNGFLLEKGPFNVLVRDESFRRLLDECADEVAARPASQDADRRYLLHRGGLHQVPTGPGALVKSPLLSARAKVRMLRGMLASAPSPDPDPTIAEAATRRLGREVAETFISSIVAGVFGGDSRQLSLRACFPTAWRFDQDCRSPLLYEMGVLRRRKRKARSESGPPPYKGLISFDGGLQALPDWIARQLGPDLVTGCRVESIDHVSSGYVVTCSNRGLPTRIACRHLVLATPKRAAADLIAPLAPGASTILDLVESSSLVVLNLAYRRRDVEHPMRGYGFLVPQTERSVPIMGVLWADSAFPHHAPADHRVVRVFMGGPRDPHATQRPDECLVSTATSAIGDLLGIRAEPDLVDVCRWPEAIPQYHLGHHERIERLESALRHLPGLHLAGNYLRGVSINDCIREGVATGRSIAASLEAPRAANPSIAGARRASPMSRTAQTAAAEAPA